MVWHLHSIRSGGTMTRLAMRGVGVGVAAMVWLGTACMGRYADEEIPAVGSATQAVTGDNLSGENLSAANLAGANMASDNLAGANLAGTNLAGQNLAGI